jgi:tRNA pseudouridine(38-40) synthase
VKLAFTTEYDGSAFSGFQRQKNAPSVQQNIEEALEKLLRTRLLLIMLAELIQEFMHYHKFLTLRLILKDRIKIGLMA